MDVARLVRDVRKQAGLSQEQLAGRAGTSQATLAGYEAGRLLPRLDTLERLLDAAGHDLHLSAAPRVRRGAVPVAAVAEELREILPAEGAAGGWRRLLDFVDDFRASSPAGQSWLVADEPPATGDPRFDAALAAIAELLCDEADLPWPEWTDRPYRFASPWWFVAGLPGFEPAALRDSPIELKRHGVFVTREAFTRA